MHVKKEKLINIQPIAISALGNPNLKQAINYYEAYNLEVGLFLSFLKNRPDLRAG